MREGKYMYNVYAQKIWEGGLRTCFSMELGIQELGLRSRVQKRYR